MISLWLKAYLLFALCLTLVGCSQRGTLSPNNSLSADSTPILLPVKVSGKWGYINGSGQLVINPQFDNVGDFREGRARVCLGKSCGLWINSTDALWGFIDTSGKVVVNPQYHFETDFREGLAAVCTGDCGGNPTAPHTYGYIDRDGKLVVPMQFGGAREFAESLAVVCVGDCTVLKDGWSGKFGVIDHSGRFVINPQYNYLASFENGFAKVGAGQGEDAKSGYIDKTGKTIWQPSN